MKSTVKFILICILLFGFSNLSNAQEVENPQEELTENNWYLSKIEIEGEDYAFESNEETEWTTLTTEQIEDQTDFYLDYCSGALGEGLIFTSNNSFVINDFIISLAECENPENNNYKLMYFNTFEENLNQVFEYVIIMENDHKSLVITTQDNSYLYYQNVPYMAVKGQQKSNLVLYPSPIKDFLYIENITERVQIDIYDLSGKALLSQELNQSTESLNLSQLSKGIYLYRINKNGQLLKTGKLIKD